MLIKEIVDNGMRWDRVIVIFFSFEVECTISLNIKQTIMRKKKLYDCTLYYTVNRDNCNKKVKKQEYSPTPADILVGI